MQHISGGNVPQYPRAIFTKPIWPAFFSETFTTLEVATEKLIHEIEVEATLPAHIRALAGALAALGGAE